MFYEGKYIFIQIRLNDLALINCI